MPKTPPVLPEAPGSRRGRNGEGGDDQLDIFGEASKPSTGDKQQYAGSRTARASIKSEVGPLTRKSTAGVAPTPRPVSQGVDASASGSKIEMDNSRSDSANSHSRKVVGDGAMTQMTNRNVVSPLREGEMKSVRARKSLALGVTFRSPMGDYLAPEGQPLSSLANPSPGPLDYDPKLPVSGFQYSILGKHPPLKLDNTGPGPSKYNIRPVAVTFNENPHWSLGVKLKDSSKGKNQTPGPFAYQNDHGTFGTDGYAYTISGRFPTSIPEAPGPDRYFPNPSSHPLAGASPKWSFGLKPKTFGEPSPGPQDYDVPWVVPSSSEAPSYTMRPRVGAEVFTNKEDQHRPGFNEYNPKLQWSEKAASLKGWYKESKAMKTPGPANYIMPNALFSGPQYSLTARALPYEEEDYYVPPPGPADYNPDACPTLAKSPHHSLGARWKECPPKWAGVPGPGAYQPKDRQIRGNDGPKITLKGRHSSKIGSTPGPADYNTSAVPTTSICAEQLARIDKKKEGTMDKEKQTTEESPGPADYNLAPMATTKTAGPKYSLAARIARKLPDPTPGPNAYGARAKLDGPRITMKSRMSPFVMVFPSNRVDTLRA
ncbi:hypothetical protein HDU67_008330 [Dinochytrium kinnereticum]|nr:hypothetical protein HDU67_008330 [Dinochytrium kinnereticum]